MVSLCTSEREAQRICLRFVFGIEMSDIVVHLGARSVGSFCFRFEFGIEMSDIVVYL